MNQRKRLEIVLANVKVLERKREKAFVQEIKIFQQKNNSIPANSTPVLSRTKFACSYQTNNSSYSYA